jgi:hypothetical protein
MRFGTVFGHVKLKPWMFDCPFRTAARDEKAASQLRLQSILDRNTGHFSQLHSQLSDLSERLKRADREIYDGNERNEDVVRDRDQLKQSLLVCRRHFGSSAKINIVIGSHEISPITRSNNTK